MKRFTLALIAGIVVGITVPAAAQTGVTARVLAPNDGEVVVGTVTVRGEGAAAAGVRSVKLFIEDSLVATRETSEVRQRLEVEHSWSTGGIRNGWYQVRVDVAAAGGGSATSHLNVRVDNAPQTPANFSGSVRDQTVSLSWAPNPEPDISGYRIEVLSGDAWSVVSETGSTNYAAEVAPGSYQYRITALRNSPTMPAGRPSDPTSPLALTVEPPPPGDVPGGGGSFGGGGATTGTGNPRIYGSDGRGTRHDVTRTARRFAGGGLSFGGLSLPGQLGLPNLPSSDFAWGTYKEQLPYSLPEGGIPLTAAPARLAALSTTKVIPLDALRWVAAGALMIVIAGLLQFLSMRAAATEKLGASNTATS